MVTQVRAQLNGEWYTLTYNETSGKYEATLTAPSTTSYTQPDGSYTITVQATDDSGNTSSRTTQLVVKETTAPVITITSPSTGAKVTNNKQPIVFTLRDSGSGVDLSTLTLKVDSGTAIGSSGMICTSVSGGYDCTYTPTTALTDGSHTVAINVKDHDGNSATEKTTTFTIDTVAPSLNVTSPQDNLKTNQASCVVSGTTNDATSSPVTVKIKLNGADQGTVTVGTGGAFSKTVTLASGSNTIIVTSTDSAGKSTSITRTVTLNTSAPVISNIVVTPNPATVGTTITISCTVTDDE